jgi:hypothetical protein
VQTTTQDTVGVGLDEMETALVQLTLKGRQLLPKAGNGRHHLPPSDPNAASVRRDMTAGKCRPWKHLLTVATCDVNDDVPVDVVTSAAREFIAAIEMLAARRRAAAGDFRRPMGVLLALETKAQQRLDLAELKLAANPTNPDAIEAVLAEADRYVGPFEALRASCRRTLVAVRALPREVIGRLTGTFKLHA